MEATIILHHYSFYSWDPFLEYLVHQKFQALLLFPFSIMKKETQNNTASPWHKFSKLLKVSKLHLNKRWCESIHLNNLLSFHEISNIPIRISSSSPHASAFKKFKLPSTKMRDQIRMALHKLNAGYLLAFCYTNR